MHGANGDWRRHQSHYCKGKVSNEDEALCNGFALATCNTTNTLSRFKVGMLRYTHGGWYIYIYIYMGTNNGFSITSRLVQACLDQCFFFLV